MKRITFIILCVFIYHIVVSQKIVNKNFNIQFKKFGVDGCFVMYNRADNEIIRYNPSLCDSGYLPASTFKIPNSLIALEEGIIKDTNQIIKWDGHEWPNQMWNMDQTLKTAMKYSCVWVFSGFAIKIGIDRYHKYINDFDYGNTNLSGPPSRFWLAGNFRISANQQIDFLRKFYYYNLHVSRRSIDIVKDIIILEQTDKYKLSGKTGGTLIDDNKYIMWMVGYIEKDNKTYFYAMNFKSDNFDKTKQTRLDLTKDILKDLKLIE